MVTLETLVTSDHLLRRIDAVIDFAFVHDLTPHSASAARPQRVITRHVWHGARERCDSHRLTPWGKAIHKRRKETVERSFADAKQLHGHRYARFRGRIRVACQRLLAAAAQNIKKTALALVKAPNPLPA